MGTRSLSLRSSSPARASNRTGRKSMSTPDVPLPGLLAATRGRAGARRFADALLPADPLGSAVSGGGMAGEEIAEWREGDRPDGPDDYLALADAEGLIRRILRARRGL